MDSVREVKTFVLPDKCFEKNVACTWRRGNQFTIYPRSQIISKSSNNIDSKLLNIKQEVLLFNPILRKLASESNGTFLTLQKSAEASKTSDNHVEFLKLSRQYRSIIRVSIENLQDAASKATDVTEKNTMMSCITIFYSVECLWHLCEILYIDNIPGDIVLPYLLEWVRFHFPCHEQTAAQLLEACERGSEEHSEYWETVVGMVVQGRVDVVRALLKLHSASESNEFKLIENSLKSMPVFSVYGGVSTGEFQVSWKHWQAECRSKLQGQLFSDHQQLDQIMRLMCGDYLSWELVRARYTSWYDVIGGWVLWTAPWSRRHELRVAAAACAGMTARATNPNTQLDQLVRALIEGDLHEVIHGAQQMSDNGWFATHLTDLLTHAGKLTVLDKHQLNVTQRLRDSLILEYGALLMEHKSLWQAGLSYLVCCPPEGPRRAELLLERIPLHTEAKAMRIISEANRHGLPNVAQTVCALVSARHLCCGRIPMALTWAMRGKCVSLCAQAAHTALRTYCERRTLPALRTMLQAGPDMLLASPLLFYGKYCDFHRRYKNREFVEAGKLLISLITSKITPDYFWENLLIDTLPLLERDELVFSSADTFEIMVSCELHAAKLGAEKAELLRLALVRNLARSSLAEHAPSGDQKEIEDKQ